MKPTKFGWYCMTNILFIFTKKIFYFVNLQITISPNSLQSFAMSVTTDKLILSANIGIIFILSFTTNRQKNRKKGTPL